MLNLIYSHQSFKKVLREGEGDKKMERERERETERGRGAAVGVHAVLVALRHRGEARCAQGCTSRP